MTIQTVTIIMRERETDRRTVSSFFSNLKIAKAMYVERNGNEIFLSTRVNAFLIDSIYSETRTGALIANQNNSNQELIAGGSLPINQYFSGILRPYERESVAGQFVGHLIKD